MPREERFVAVLAVEAVEVAAQIQKLTGGLAEVLNITQQEAGDRVVRHVRVEGEESRLLEEVVDIDLCVLAMKAEGETVGAHQDVQIVAQRVVCATEGGLGIVTHSEETAHQNLVDLFECRLPNVDAEIGHADASGKRSATGVFNLIGKVQVIQDTAVEGVGL